MLTDRPTDRLTHDVIGHVVSAALTEDSPWGDLTTQSTVPPRAEVEAELRARESGVLSGVDVFAAVMSRAGSGVWTTFERQDGERFEAGDRIARLSGAAQVVLRAERIALNLIQRMCGVATLTAAYVDAVRGTAARIVDTRKTTPGLRALERHAVRCGGGHNHRFGLSDAVLIKDNHLAVLGARSGRSLTEALLEVRATLSHTSHLEVEVDRIDQIEPVLAAGVDTIMLDNFTPEQLAEGVAAVRGRALVEASGGIALETVRAVAESGVDLISVGALTHAARAVDLGLDIRPDDQKQV